MRAVWYQQAGAAAQVLQCDEWPEPQPGPGEVRVHIAVSAVNPTDIKRRQSGRELGLFERIIPHNDGAGRIDKVGPDVPHIRAGQPVWIFGAQAMRAHGTAADYVVLPARQAITLPSGITFDSAACLGVPAVTAHRCLFSDGDINGQTVLISGAAGRVGRCAVQLAKWAGADVIATVGSAAKAAEMHELGADAVLRYDSDDIVAEVQKLGRADRIVEVEFGANIEYIPDLLKPNGVVVSYGSDAVAKPTMPFHALMYNNITLRLIAIFGMPQQAQNQAFSDINRCLGEYGLQSKIGKRFTLDETIAAHQALEAGIDGCVLIDVNPAGRY